MYENDVVKEVSEVNLAYLLLAQRMLRDDKAVAMFRLGLSQELADLLGSLSFSQVMKLAASNSLLCRFRFDDHAILSSLTHDKQDFALQQSHVAILLAGQQVEGVR
jgi:flagellar transcriptional activator FlhD